MKPDHILLAFAYDGTGFHGVWPQPDVPTVGEALLRRLTDALGRRPEMFVVTARTDARVSATLNLATVRLWPHADTRGLNDVSRERSDGLGAVRALRVGSHVYARGLAHRKQYSYAWSQALDVERMRRAARAFLTLEDVSALRGRRVDPSRCAGVTIDRADVLQTPDGVVLLVEAQRFVRWQVRKMAGLLGAVGRHERPVEDVARVLASGDPLQGEAPAEGRGLTLSALELSPGRWTHTVADADLASLAAAPATA